MSAIARLARLLLQPPTRDNEPILGRVVERARIVQVYGGGEVLIEWRGTVTLASQATDEPLSAGNAVWVSETESGLPVIHGSIK